MEFKVIEACEAYIGPRLEPGLCHLEQEMRKAFVASVATQFLSPGQSAPTKAFALKIGRWVVRDDDLKLVDELNKALVAAAGVGFFLDGTKVSAAAITGVALAMVAVLRNAVRSSASLSDDQLAVLVALANASERPTTEALLDAIESANAAVPEASSWDEARLKRALSILKDYPTKAGIRHFVSVDGNGGWGLEGI